ncbi:MarR family winged helix-turn-helix transcriptional regulator [Dactylosporangium darangshiense]|uniref:MarR family winged helix-turn-helix transcriptional regulator n=1 Tax=Dactylosporangium darangshiense TaxID=579108 RepID=UPI0036438F0F
MSPDPSPAAAAAARDLVVVFRRLRARLRELPSGGLTPSQTSVLVRLHRDGASTTTALALAEGVRSQSMTATLSALDDLGLIERSPDPDDGRRHIIALSAAGQGQGERGQAGPGRVAGPGAGPPLRRFAARDHQCSTRPARRACLDEFAHTSLLRSVC